MPTTAAYQSSRNGGITLNRIQIRNDDMTFFNKVKPLLDVIDGTPLGAAMLDEIEHSTKKVFILPTASPSDGNKCTSGGDTIFYRLRAALRGAGGMSVRTELGRALMGAAQMGWTMEKIGEVLSGGMSPATVRTQNNLVNKLNPFDKQKQYVKESTRIAKLIEDVADGKKPASKLSEGGVRGKPTLADNLVRFLRPWLTPGTGGGSKINFNPDGLLSCMGDTLQERPPEIGLAHELCHAWRNAVGQRLFDDAMSCGLDDDEVMTTGFPPYQYEKYNENLFRRLLADVDTPLPMRVNYR